MGQWQHVEHNTADYKQSEGGTDGEHVRAGGSKTGKNGENHGVENRTKG